jgi:Ca2+-binding EF-hand superfamily protein
MACWFLTRLVNSNSTLFNKYFASFSPNGKLSKDRFVSVYEQFYPGGKAKDFCKYAFATFDRDNNGTSM